MDETDKWGKKNECEQVRVDNKKKKNKENMAEK